MEQREVKPGLYLATQVTATKGQQPDILYVFRGLLFPAGEGVMAMTLWPSVQSDKLVADRVYWRDLRSLEPLFLKPEYLLELHSRLTILESPPRGFPAATKAIIDLMGFPEGYDVLRVMHANEQRLATVVKVAEEALLGWGSFLSPLDDSPIKARIASLREELTRANRG